MDSRGYVAPEFNAERVHDIFDGWEFVFKRYDVGFVLAQASRIAFVNAAFKRESASDASLSFDAVASMRAIARTVSERRGFAGDITATASSFRFFCESAHATN